MDDRWPSMSTIDNVVDDFDVGTNDDAFFDIEEERLFVKYLSETSTAENDSPSDKQDDATTDQVSLIDAIASSAKTNLSAMKLQVDKSLLDSRSSQIHLSNYREFIEKKKKQRIQCLRDMRMHCCKCRGPHIARPPFSHGKDYRREPTHTQHQGNGCLFLKRKMSELKWLEETLGKYSENSERFELEIEKCKADTECKKENMQEALANNLRLMEIVATPSWD